MIKPFKVLLVLGCYSPLLWLMALLNPFESVALSVGLCLLSVLGIAAVCFVPIMASNIKPITSKPESVEPLEFSLGYFVPYLFLSRETSGFLLTTAFVILAACIFPPDQMLVSSYILRLFGWKAYVVTINGRRVTVLSKQFIGTFDAVELHWLGMWLAVEL